MPAENIANDKSVEQWLGMRAPRYTSYPTAPCFTTQIAPQDYRALLAALPEEPLSLYIHIPFCRSLCLFCGCHTMITNREERIRDYCDLLFREIAMVAAATARKPKVAQLHFGGGSPGILDEGLMGALFERLHRAFDIGTDAVVAIELDPRIVTRAQVTHLARLGFNRVSLGVQDFAPEVQEAVHRVQPHLMIAHLCAWLRADGIDAINFDLMYGLPHQTEESVTATAMMAMGLRPARVALFSYAHVPWMKKHQQAIDVKTLPDDTTLLRLEAAARHVFAQAGMIPIGIDHFARPDDELAQAFAERRLHRNFQGYTTDTSATMLGLGLSAIGALPSAYVQNASQIEDYAAMIAANALPVKRSCPRSAEDHLRGAVIESLMCYAEADLAALCGAHGFDIACFADEIVSLHPLREAGLIGWDGRKITYLNSHRMGVRAVCTFFDQYFGKNEARYSKVV